MVALTLTGQQVPQPSAIEVTLQLWLQQTFGGSQLLWWKARQTGDCSTKVPIQDNPCILLLLSHQSHQISNILNFENLYIDNVETMYVDFQKIG